MRLRPSWKRATGTCARMIAPELSRKSTPIASSETPASVVAKTGIRPTSSETAPATKMKFSMAKPAKTRSPSTSR
jgi:hypothetical protein